MLSGAARRFAFETCATFGKRCVAIRVWSLLRLVGGDEVRISCDSSDLAKDEGGKGTFEPKGNFQNLPHPLSQAPDRGRAAIGGRGRRQSSTSSGRLTIS